MVSSTQILGFLLSATRRHGLAALALGALAMLAGCGQKGALFISGPPLAGTMLTRRPPAVIEPAAPLAPVSPASAAR